MMIRSSIHFKKIKKTYIPTGGYQTTMTQAAPITGVTNGTLKVQLSLSNDLTN